MQTTKAHKKPKETPNYLSQSEKMTTQVQKFNKKRLNYYHPQIGKLPLRARKNAWWVNTYSSLFLVAIKVVNGFPMQQLSPLRMQLLATLKDNGTSRLTKKCSCARATRPST